MGQASYLPFTGFLGGLHLTNEVTKVSKKLSKNEKIQTSTD